MSVTLSGTRALNSNLRLTVFVILLCSGVLSAQQNVEIPVAPVNLRHSPYSQSAPAIASNGRDFLLVWDSEFGTYGQDSIEAARVSSNGELIDPVRLSLGGGHGGTSVLWTGSKYLVAWGIVGSRFGEILALPDVAITTVGADGVVGTVRTVRKTLQSADATQLSLNKSAVMLAYISSDRKLYVRPLTSDGEPLGDELLIGSATSYSMISSPTDEGFLLAVKDGSSLNLVSISPEGALRTTQSLEEKVDAFQLVVGDGGIRLFWSRAGQLLSARIDGSLSTNHATIDEARVSGALRVVSTPHGYVIAVEEQRSEFKRQIRLIETDAAARQVGSLVVRPGDSNSQPALGTNGSDVLFAHVEYPLPRLDGYSDLQGKLLRGGRLPGSEQKTLAIATASQGALALAPAGDRYLVLWQEFVQSEGAERNFIRIFDRDGYSLTDPILIDRKPVHPLLIQFNGQAFIVIGDTTGEIVLDRVSLDGAVLGEREVLGATKPAVGNRATAAFNGIDFLVAWTSVGTPTQIVATKVSRDGRVETPGGAVVFPNTVPQQNPVVGWQGDRYVLAWTQNSVPGVPSLISVPLNRDGLVDGEHSVVSRSFVPSTSRLVWLQDRFSLVGVVPYPADIRLLNLDSYGRRLPTTDEAGVSLQKRVPSIQEVRPGPDGTLWVLTGDPQGLKIGHYDSAGNRRAADADVAPGSAGGGFLVESNRLVFFYSRNAPSGHGPASALRAFLRIVPEGARAPRRR